MTTEKTQNDYESPKVKTDEAKQASTRIKRTTKDGGQVDSFSHLAKFDQNTDQGRITPGTRM